MNQAEFLDQVRSIAQLGLNYTRDSYDLERYEHLLKLASDGYAELANNSAGQLLTQFRRELGYITAKVGVDGAVFSGDGERLLLIRRADSGRWALPGGWVDPGQTSEEAAARELEEETTLTVKVGEVIAVSSQLPEPGSSPHTSVHILYHCIPVAGTPTATSEAIEARFLAPDRVSDWHQDHGLWAEKAMTWRNQQ